VECFLSICSSSADKPFNMLSMSFNESRSQFASSLHSHTQTCNLHTTQL